MNNQENSLDLLHEIYDGPFEILEDSLFDEYENHKRYQMESSNPKSDCSNDTMNSDLLRADDDCHGSSTCTMEESSYPYSTSSKKHIPMDVYLMAAKNKIAKEKSLKHQTLDVQYWRNKLQGHHRQESNPNPTSLNRSKDSVIVLQKKSNTESIQNIPVSKTSKVFFKFKYWTCKLCGKEGIPFDLMNCNICGRSKKFIPMNERIGKEVIHTKKDPKREEKEFLKEDKNEISVEKRIERQYLYSKDDFEIDNRKKLVSEVNDLISSIRHWM